MSTNRRQPGAYSQKPPVSPEGLPLCRQCRHLVSPPRITFCSDGCVHEWKLRTQPAYLRRCLFNRDHGICAVCGVDTVKLYRQFWQEMQDAKKTGQHRAVMAAWKAKGFRTSTRSFWDADHVLAVSEGGGECGLDNMQTLCSACHRTRTVAQTKARAIARSLAKKAELG